MTIRDAEPADKQAIADATIQAFEQYAAIMPGHWEMYRENILATLAEPGPAQQIVAEADGRIVGAVLLYPAGYREPVGDGYTEANPWPIVRLLAVPPASRGRGVGRALMDECVRRAIESGSDAIMLHSNKVMESAVGLYQRMGFVQDSRLDLEVAPGVIIDGYRLDFAT